MGPTGNGPVASRTSPAGGEGQGLEGQGLFALTYRLSGPVDEPDIAINPLSALAPGVLRRILFGGGTEDRPTQGARRHEDR